MQVLYKFGNYHFCIVDTARRNAKKNCEYVKNQLDDDIISDQIDLMLIYR